MDDKKYPIGTLIVFKPIGIKREVVLKDYGKVGKLVGIVPKYSNRRGYNRLLIVLKGSTHVSNMSSSRLFVTWCTTWRNLELAKNQQLLFDFAYER